MYFLYSLRLKFSAQHAVHEQRSVKDQISHSYNTKDKIPALYNLFAFITI